MIGLHDCLLAVDSDDEVIRQRNGQRRQRSESTLPGSSRLAREIKALERGACAMKQIDRVQAQQRCQ